MYRETTTRRKQPKNLLLTTVTKLSEYSNTMLLLFCLPVTISSSNTPKLYTSAFSVNWPWARYSGAIYPLQDHGYLRYNIASVSCNSTRVFPSYYSLFKSSKWFMKRYLQSSCNSCTYVALVLLKGSGQTKICNFSAKLCIQ